MPRNGSGSAVGVSSSFNPAVSGTVIDSGNTGWAATYADILAMLTQSLSKDGQTTPTNNLTLGGFKLINVADGTLATDAATFGQLSSLVISGGFITGTSGGTANAITLTTSAGLSAYADGQAFIFVAPADNTGATTFKVDALTADAVTVASSALVGSTIKSGQPYIAIRNNGVFDLFSSSGQQIQTAGIADLAVTTGKIADITEGTLLGSNVIAPVTISTITRSGTLATLTTATAHNLTTGNVITLAGQSPSQYAGTYPVTVTGATTFTYTMASDPGGSASTLGTYTVGKTGVQEITVGTGLSLSAGTLTAIASSKVAGFYSGSYSSVAGLTNAVPLTSSTPTSTQGTAIITLANVVTTSSTQVVVLNFNGLAGTLNCYSSVILFRGTTFVDGNAGPIYSNDQLSSLTCLAVDAPGAAGTYSYVARVGPDSGTMRMNGSVSGGSIWGSKTWLTAAVIEP